MLYNTSFRVVFRSTTTLIKIALYILYSVKIKPCVINSYNLELSPYGNFNVKQSRKIG